MTYSTLELNCDIRRAKLGNCGGMEILPHDLNSFCIPSQSVDNLSESYRRYLIGAGLIDWQNLQDKDEEDFNEYRCTISFFHQKEKMPLITGEFSLGSAIDFVWSDAKVPQSLAIRWCMMMEFIIWRDHQYDLKQGRQSSIQSEHPAIDDEHDDIEA